jgi:hypothetical protein
MGADEYDCAAGFVTVERRRVGKPAEPQTAPAEAALDERRSRRGSGSTSQRWRSSASRSGVFSVGPSHAGRRTGSAMRCMKPSVRGCRLNRGLTAA